MAREDENHLGKLGWALKENEEIADIREEFGDLVANQVIDQRHYTLEQLKLLAEAARVSMRALETEIEMILKE